MRWLLLAIAGALLCTVGDHLHATLGVLVYSHADVWGQPLWVAPMFALAAIVCVATARPFVADLPPPKASLLLSDALGFMGAYVYTSFAPPDRPSVTLAVLAGAFVVRVLGERRSARVVVYSLLLGLGGVVTERMISATGGFHYLHPDWLKTPRWLAAIYFHAGLLSADIAARHFPQRAR